MDELVIYILGKSFLSCCSDAVTVVMYEERNSFQEETDRTTDVVWRKGKSFVIKSFWPESLLVRIEQYCLRGDKKKKAFSL